MGLASRADEVICTSDEDVVDRVKQITGGKLAYAAVDCIAGDMTDTISAATRPGGTVYVRACPPMFPSMHTGSCCSSLRM